MPATADRRRCSGGRGNTATGIGHRQDMTTSDAVGLRPAPAGPAQLYDQYARHIYRYCARRVGHQVAEDLVGEVFLVAVRAGACPTEPLPWLYGIATNMLRRHRRAEVRAYRAYARTGADPLDNVAGVAESHEASSADRVSATADVRRIAAALASLPRRQRDVLLLYGIAELSYAEIPTALGIPLGSVQSALHGARLRLRRVLDLPRR